MEKIKDSETRQELSGDFEKLVETYTGLINKVCFMYSSDRSEYSEMRQDVIVNLWKGIARFRGECKVSTWIYRIALNTCISYSKRSRLWSRKHERIDLNSGLESKETGVSESTSHLHEMLNCLGKVDKSLIMLSLDDYSYEEISEITGMSKSAVATRIHRAKEKLRKTFKKEN